MTVSPEASSASRQAISLSNRRYIGLLGISSTPLVVDQDARDRIDDAAVLEPVRKRSGE